MRTLWIIAVCLALTGCRLVGLESMHSSTESDNKFPGHGDPYTWGGIQEGTGGQVAATRQSMESTKYSEPKFKRLAGQEGFTSMSGFEVRETSTTDRPGDYQPLTTTEHTPNQASGGH